MSLEDVVNVQISGDAPAITRAGFGVPLIAAYHTHNTDRVRSYTSLTAMVSDGFATTEAAYRMASVMFSQSPRVPRIRVGRRASAFTQVVHLTPSAPSAGNVFTAKIDGLSASATADGTPTLSEVCTALAASINALSVEDAIIATGGSAMLAQTLSGAAFDGAVGAGAISPPRALVLTLSASGDWLATTATVTGKDIDGNVITDTFAIPGGGGVAVLGAGGKHFAKSTSVTIPAQDGPGGAFTLGTRAPVTAVATGGTHVVCTAPVAGELHSYELATGNLTIADHTTDPGIAADLSAIQTANGDWYGLLLDSNSADEISEAAAWAEASGKLFGAQSADSDCLDSASTASIAYVIKTAAYARTGLWFHPSLATPTSWLAAGIMGNRFPADPGSDTWALKRPAGVSGYALTDTQRSALDTNHANYLLAAAGVYVTWEGKSGAGDWIDTTRGSDWLKNDLEVRVFELKLARPKIPFTDGGIDSIRSEITASLNGGVRVGFLAADPAPTVNTPAAKDVSASDKRARRLNGVTFHGTLAGAIHATSITGSVTV